MQRRQFLKTSAGFTALALAPGIWRCAAPPFEKKQIAFVKDPFKDAEVPIIQVSPDDGGIYQHTFYDVNPWSPSQRLFLITKLPYQDKGPQLGDEAVVCVVDLEEQTLMEVYRTKAWAFQTCSRAQWGAGDRYVYTNDYLGGEVVCVRVDLHTGETKAFAGPMTSVAESGDFYIGPRLDIISATQWGYGMPNLPKMEGRWAIPDSTGGGLAAQLAGPPDQNGLWLTDMTTNEKRLVVTRKQIRQTISDPEYYENGIFHFFHCNLNAQADRIIFHLRCLLPKRKGGRNSQFWSVKTDGTELTEFYGREKFGYRGPEGTANHFNWHPNGRQVVGNMVPYWQGDEHMRFGVIDPLGHNYETLADNVLGSGHPRIHASGNYLVADTYPFQTYAGADDMKVPLRFIDLRSEKETVLCRVWNDFAVHAGYKYYWDAPGGSHLKLDPHPNWSRDHTKICFNGAPRQRRAVFIADVSSLVS